MNVTWVEWGEPTRLTRFDCFSDTSTTSLRATDAVVLLSLVLPRLSSTVVLTFATQFAICTEITFSFLLPPSMPMRCACNMLVRYFSVSSEAVGATPSVLESVIGSGARARGVTGGRGGRAGKGDWGDPYSGGGTAWMEGWVCETDMVLVGITMIGVWVVLHAAKRKARNGPVLPIERGTGLRRMGNPLSCPGGKHTPAGFGTITRDMIVAAPSYTPPGITHPLLTGIVRHGRTRRKAPARPRFPSRHETGCFGGEPGAAGLASFGDGADAIAAWARASKKIMNSVSPGPGSDPGLRRDAN